MDRASERRIREALSERRDSNRYPLTLEVRYAVSGCPTPVPTGSGRAIDVSSTGLSFTAERPLATGQVLDVSIDWPVLLDGCVQLQLMLSGVVVRTKGTTAALRIHRHEFRTRSLAPKAVPPRQSA